MSITDIHAHILPGIDDGARDWETCMLMLERSAESGVRRIIATPHYLPWKKNADPDMIKCLCKEAEERFRERSDVLMQIDPGHEIWYHAEAVERLKSGMISTLAGSRYVLVEFSTRESYINICRAVQSFRESGYLPILAHTERYESLKQPGRLGELRILGAYLQMNMEVFATGRFTPMGRRIRRILGEAGRDTDASLIHFLASDMHNTDSRPPMSRQLLNRAQKVVDDTSLKQLLSSNSDRIRTE